MSVLISKTYLQFNYLLLFYVCHIMGRNPNFSLALHKWMSCVFLFDLTINATSDAQFLLVYNVNNVSCDANRCTLAKMSGKFNVNSARFGASSKDEIKQLLQDRNAKNTNRATKSSVTALREYLKEKGLPILEEILDCDLPDLLEQFYADARKKNNEFYHTQSMKNIRSGLNR